MYDITSPFCTICGSVPKMDYTPMTVRPLHTADACAEHSSPHTTLLCVFYSRPCPQMDIWADRGSSKECEMVIIGDAGGLIHLHRIQPNNKQDSLQVRCHPCMHRHCLL